MAAALWKKYQRCGQKIGGEGIKICFGLSCLPSPSIDLHVIRITLVECLILDPDGGRVLMLERPGLARRLAVAVA